MTGISRGTPKWAVIERGCLLVVVVGRPVRNDERFGCCCISDRMSERCAQLNEEQKFRWRNCSHLTFVQARRVITRITRGIKSGSRNVGKAIGNRTPRFTCRRHGRHEHSPQTSTGAPSGISGSKITKYPIKFGITAVNGDPDQAYRESNLRDLRRTPLQSEG